MSSNVVHKKKERTCERIIEAIYASRGLLTLAAKKAGVCYRTVIRYAEEFESVKKAIDESQNQMLDVAEGKLFQAIGAENMTAIIFFLKTRGKARGYVERQEFSGPEGGPIVTTNAKDKLWEAISSGSEGTTARQTKAGPISSN